MTVPVFRTGSISLTIVFALAVALGLFLSDNASAAPYNPTSDYNYCNQLPDPFPPDISGGIAALNGDDTCLQRGAAADTATDLTAEFIIPGYHPEYGEDGAAAGTCDDDIDNGDNDGIDAADPDCGDSNFGSPVITMTNAGNYVAPDALVTDGDIAGGFISAVTLGLMNGKCTTPMVVNFILYDSETENSNQTAVCPEGTLDRWSTVEASGAGGGCADGIINDANQDHYADSDSLFVTKNPSFYPRLFDPDADYPTATGIENGPKDPIEPVARYTGATRVPPLDGEWQILTFFQFAPGAFDEMAADPDNYLNPLGLVGNTNMYMSMSWLNDPSAVKLAPSTISDFCTTLATKTMLLSHTSPGGTVRGKTGPDVGTEEILQYSYGYRDADDDGYENYYDTCAFTANTGDDTDSDGIDDACDLVVGGDSDVDDDGYSNRQDNCPQTANGVVQGDEGSDSENTTAYATAAPDKGKRNDDIGDACDPNPNTSHTEGGFEEQLNLMTVCIGDTDADNDGVCDAEAGTFTSRIVNTNAPFVDASDPDGDLYNTGKELFIGTDPLDNCPDHSGHDAWAPDITNDGTTNIVDVGEYRDPFNTNAGEPNYSARHDLTVDGTVNIVDIGEFRDPFNQTCS